MQNDNLVSGANIFIRANINWCIYSNVCPVVSRAAVKKTAFLDPSH